VAVKHTFVSAIADGVDATLVRPSNWNATHTIDAGQATIPFATFLKQDSVAVTGQTNIVAGSLIFANVFADNDDVLSQEWQPVLISNLVVGTGFTLTLMTTSGKFKGPVKINWFWI